MSIDLIRGAIVQHFLDAGQFPNFQDLAPYLPGEDRLLDIIEAALNQGELRCLFDAGQVFVRFGVPLRDSYWYKDRSKVDKLGTWLSKIYGPSQMREYRRSPKSFGPQYAVMEYLKDNYV